MCFKGQNVNISDTSLVNAKALVARLGQKLREARRTTTSPAKLAHWLSEYQHAVAEYNLALIKLANLHVTPGFCKVTSS